MAEKKELPSYGLSVLYPLFNSFLSNRKIREVLLDGSTSETFTINIGVPQGFVLGSTLFLLNINDLLNFTSEPIHSYADDSTLYSSFSFERYPFTQQVVDSRNYSSTILKEDIVEILNWG